jgi:hypothetical protein
MATKEVMIGSMGPFLYEDTEHDAIKTDGNIKTGIQEVDVLNVLDHIQADGNKVIGVQQGAVANAAAATAASPTLVDVTAVDADVQANFEELETQIDAILVDIASIRVALNSLLTAIKAHGLIES